MHRTLRALPSLDFLRGFEAAGRRLSFTLAAQELYLTQSALSRQIKALEDALGVVLFERRHRALALTSAGSAFHREVTDVLQSLADASERVRAGTRSPALTLSTTVSFASLWIIPRLASFRARHPDVEVYVSADASTNTLIVEAPAERRASFEALVEQLDRVELPPAAELRTYRIERGSPEQIASTLTELARRGVLSRQPDDGSKPVEVLVQAEPVSRTLMTACPPGARIRRISRAARHGSSQCSSTWVQRTRSYDPSRRPVASTVPS